MIFKINYLLATAFMLIITILISCKPSSHQQMIELLQKIDEFNHKPDNAFAPEVKLVICDSLLHLKGNSKNVYVLENKAPLLLKTGNEDQSVAIYANLKKRLDSAQLDKIMPDAAIAYMRMGERNNCMMNKNGSSCIFPIKDGGVHLIKAGSSKAIDAYERILKAHPNDLESRWLLNIAYMTLGGYPQKVPQQFLIPGLDADTINKVKPFTDAAADLGLNVKGRAGGVIIDDFNNDGYLDMVTSGWMLGDPMHYFKNNGDGTFTDVSDKSGLKGITGGLNIEQMDYNNDGFKDIFVLRGAWHNNGYGNQPSSLLRNNGDGTFTDVTIPSGLLFLHPTQAATWADFNNDGWLDVFIGVESPMGYDTGEVEPSMLYINNHDGTFTNVAMQAHCTIVAFVKGTTVADYNNDGWADIFVSSLDGHKHLLRNKGRPGKIPDFEDVTDKAGIAQNVNGTFTTWFYDYNNDGWPDIMVADYTYDKSLGYYAAAAALGKPEPNNGNIYLYRNNKNGTFTNVTKETGLDKVVFSMGANFGDIDNDGYPDMYFGTGNPDFKSLVPNKLFRNLDGKKFVDVTTSSHTGNLQKGHGVAFADFRNSGKQDIFVEMGGAFVGDAYTSSLYLNPGQNSNNWINLNLEGVICNRAAIGSRIKITFTENGIKRSVYKEVNSGGSFGSSPLAQEIGIGQAKIIDDIEIRWAGSKRVQHFRNITPNRFLHITEGENKLRVINLKQLVFKKKTGVPICMPTKPILTALANFKQQ